MIRIKIRKEIDRKNIYCLQYFHLSLYLLRG